MRIVLLAAVVALVAHAGAKDAGAPACGDEEMKAVAARAIRTFCAGTKDGCDLTVRRETRKVVAWRIHGHFPNGKPKFVPDDNRIVELDESCRAVKVLSHGGEQPVER